MTNFLPGATAPEQFEQAYWFVFQRSNILLKLTESGPEIPRAASLAEAGIEAIRCNFIGTLGDTPCFAAEIERKADLPAGYRSEGLRGIFGRVDDTLFWIASRAVQVVDWDRNHQFCGRCGAETKTSGKEHVKACPNCRLTAYPRISPAVIVRVTKGDRILLGHNRRYPPNYYSVLAGFVEAGETLEDTVRREIKEEVGIDVDNIRYFASQPWPFPNSLMLGFTAEYAGGDFIFEDEDVESADWFAADDMPLYPPPPSIANALIVSWLEEQGADADAHQRLWNRR